MAKVSVGLRGWRFEENDIFTDDGDWKPLDEIPEDPRDRLLRLQFLVEEPCDACYLVHGEEDVQQCNQATIVYGEPGDEVLLCSTHEPDFHYWFHEEDGRDLAGEEEFRDAFHEWFAAGNRAPEDYGSTEHVEVDPEGLPDLPTPQEVQERIEAEAEEFQKVRYDVREAADWYDPDEDEEELGDEDLDDADLDLDTDYPTR